MISGLELFANQIKDPINRVHAALTLRIRCLLAEFSAAFVDLKGATDNLLCLSCIYLAMTWLQIVQVTRGSLSLCCVLSSVCRL